MSKIYLSLALLMFLLLTVSLKPDENKNVETDKLLINKGKLLAIYNGCMECHSPKKEVDYILIPDPDRLFSGHPENEKLPDIPGRSDRRWKMVWIIYSWIYSLGRSMGYIICCKSYS